MITGRQIREARRLLKWAQWRLADKAGLALNTVATAENENSTFPVAPESLAKLKAVIEAAGVEFIPDNGGGAGVKLRKPGASE